MKLAVVNKGAGKAMNWCEASKGGVSVTVSDKPALLADVRARFDGTQDDISRGFAVATLNLDHVVKLSRNPQFRDAYAAHTHVTADGNPIVWLSRLSGQQDVSLVPGSELVLPLAELASERGVPVALFGATQETLERVKRELCLRFPGLQIVLCRAPDMDFDPHSEAVQTDIDAIAASGAGLCFLALGAPKQEIFAARAHAMLPDVGFVSVGAGLDFIAGTQTRAPGWARAIAAEWLWRLLQDPKRLAARYAACFAILPRLTGRALRARRQIGLQ